LQQHLGFLRQAAHHDAQKSTIVTFPKLLRETTFKEAKSEVHLSSPTGAAVAPTAGIDFSKFCFYGFSSLLSYF
jgi:hypothetical protein